MRKDYKIDVESGKWETKNTMRFTLSNKISASVGEHCHFIMGEKRASKCEASKSRFLVLIILDWKKDQNIGVGKERRKREKGLTVYHATRMISKSINGNGE